MATTDTWDSPALDQPINADLPAIKNKLQALVKGDPSLVQNPPVGAKRLVEISSGNWQVQQYNGSTWVNLGKLQMDVDTVDGYDAAITPQANTIAVRNASGKLEGDITGNAASADSAATLSDTLPVNKGGTGATTSVQARDNLGVPPKSHASATTTHGVGNATQYGHLKLSDATDSASGATGGIAATPAAVKATKDAALNAASEAKGAADDAMEKASTLATATDPGIAYFPAPFTAGSDGKIGIRTATVSQTGIVQLNNTITSTSTTQAATANAVKTAYDKAVEAEAAVANALPVGALLPSFASSMSGYLLCNGSAVSRATYADLFAKIGTKFGSGDGSITFNLPDFRNKTFWGANGNLMSVISAGLPNIKGTWSCKAIDGATTSGAVRTLSSGGGSYDPNGRGPESFSFDASKYDPIYGRSTTVQPPAIAANIFIKY